MIKSYQTLTVPFRNVQNSIKILSGFTNFVTGQPVLMADLLVFGIPESYKLI